jgi:leucyl-tRNA synthetase
VETADTALKYYNLVEFPYPSAEGLHVGHVYTYCGADTLGRYMTMHGRQVMQPMGFDSFGIHTENYAIKINEDPKIVTDRTTVNYRRQLERIGANWTWDMELRTDDPEYYRWTQWIFVQLFKAGLAERKEAAVVWCPSCRTVLAFEQVEGNQCERCDTVVTKKLMRQWFLRITNYADDLLDALDSLDWPDVSKRLQREWIGRSRGTDVKFTVSGHPDTKLMAFTTRADTIYGVTYVAIAPEHPFVEYLIDNACNGSAVADYVAEVTARVGIDRYSKIGETGPKGVVTDVSVIHPFTGAEMPIVVADYVLGDYGTGVVMGVPAHDERDYEVAMDLGLPIIQVVEPNLEDTSPDTGSAWSGEGKLVDSAQFTGMYSAAARERISSLLKERDLGGPATRYRLQDWLVSRQRYWGTPIPVIYCSVCGTVPVPEDDLPVELPTVTDFQPTGTGLSPLAAVDEFVHVKCPACGGPAERETDVFDTFVESSWYFLRYPSHDRNDVAWDPEITHRLLPVDMYAGGIEHATRHHLYARFMTRALYQLGHVGFQEPFHRLRLHGLLIKDGAKMSKSRGNVVNPDDYIDQVGADNLRTYLLFCGPWEEGGDFTDKGLQGVVRFSARLSGLITASDLPDGLGVDMRRMDRAVIKISRDIERLKFNTAIAELMALSNWLRDQRGDMTADQWRQATRTVVLLLAPFQPFMAEELWRFLGGTSSVHTGPWPDYDEESLLAEEVDVPVQINGKFKGTVTVAANASEEAVLEAALKNVAISSTMGGKQPRRVVFVPGRALSLVV